MSHNHKLPLEHIDSLFVEARRLQAEALTLRDAQIGNSQEVLLRQALLLIQDVMSYTLPSGLRLSANAMMAALERQIAQGRSPTA